MAYELAERLVIGIASSALFDLAESDAYFREHGEDAYRRYQIDRVDDVLRPGVAFEFIRRLLSLNDLSLVDNPLVEVIVLSRNDPQTGLRVMRSIEKHELPISRAVFTQGRPAYAFIGAFDMSLFLSASDEDVRAAIAQGFPAGTVLGEAPEIALSDDEVRVAFDFDGVIADDSAEQIHASSGLGEFKKHEALHAEVPLATGPLAELLRDLNYIQGIESQRKQEDSSYTRRLRLSIVTARNAPAHERTVQTLRSNGLEVNEAFFLGGIEKRRVLDVLKPHIYFDDQLSHLRSPATTAANVHVPFGGLNRTSTASSPGDDQLGFLPPLAEPKSKVL